MQNISLPSKWRRISFKKYKYIFKKPREICNCDWKLFVDIDKTKMINKINENISIFSLETEKDYFIKQTNLGDCFLVASIISIVNIPGKLDY